MTNDHKPGDTKSQYLLPRGAGGWTSETQQAAVPTGKISPCFSHRLVASIPGLVATSLQSLLFLCVSVISLFLSLTRTLMMAFRAQLDNAG